MIKVMIVDDNAIVRDGIKAIIEQAPDIKVVGCAANGKETVDLCTQVRPDLVLMEIQLPVCDGAEATRLIKEKDDSIKVVILTTFDDQESIKKALDCGADGYLLKEIHDHDLIRIVNGLSVFQEKVFKKIKSTTKLHNDEKKMEQMISVLSEREKMVIKLIVDGKGKREIAGEMHLAEGTVKNIISEILKKCDLKNRIQLAVFAVMNDLV